MVIAVVLNSENNFIIVKLTVWAWCGVAIMNRQIVYVFTCLQTLVNKSLYGKAAKLCLANNS